MYPYNIKSTINYQLNKNPQPTMPIPQPAPAVIPSPEPEETPKPEVPPTPEIQPMPSIRPVPLPSELSKPIINKYILKLIEEAIADEQKDSDYYYRLSQVVEFPEDKEIIRKMHLDESKHEKIFKEIYAHLTGEEPPEQEFTPRTISDNLTDNFKEDIFGELEAVEFYRKLYTMFLNVEIRDWLYEIITDEQAHAQKNNYLYSKYHCMNY